MSRMMAGRYVPGTSVIHRLDARVKIMGLCLLLAAIVSASTFLGYLLVVCAAVSIVALARIPACIVLSSVRRLWLFCVILLLMNALFFGGDNAVWFLGFIRVSWEGVLQGVRVVANVALIMVLANVVTATTTPVGITSALVSLLAPLRLIRVPVEDVAMILNVAIQFIPTLAQEADMIKMAQTARGARFESRRLREKAVSFLPLILPIFLASFRRADELSIAMEARGYRNGRNRTKRAAVPLCLADVAAVLGCLGVFLIGFLFFK